MKSFFNAIIFTVVFLSIFTFSHEADGEMPATSPNMLVLDDSSIDQAIATNQKILIEFYAPWCGYCQAFAQKYENIADRVAADPSIDVKIAKLDGDANGDAMNKFKAEYFPTLLLFSDGTPEQYNGDLEEDAVLRFLETGENPAAEGSQEDQNEETPQIVPPFEISTAEELTTNVEEASEDRPLLLAFFSADLIEAFETALKDSVFSGVSYAYVTKSDVAKSLKNVQVTMGSIILFDQNGAKATLKFDDAAQLPEKTDIIKFLKANRFPEIGIVTMKNIEDYWRMEAEDNMATLYAVSPDGRDDEKLVALLKSATEGLTKPLQVAMMKETDEIFTTMLSEMGLPKDSLMITVGASSQYNFKGDLSDDEAVKQFVKDYDAGTLKQFTKSQPIPEKNDGPVYVVVADSFDDVIGKENDVLLECYAPWCGHCQELEPKYVKVGEAFQGVEGLVIAKFDADGNTPPPQIQGFPTLLFYPKGSTEPLEYDGNMEAKDIIEWVKEKSSADTSGVKHEL